MAHVGRPSKLTPQSEKLLLDGVKLGATYADSAAYAGVSVTTVANWIERGKTSQSGEYFDFWHKLELARSQGKVELLTKIEKAATDGDWRAAAWKLERRDPEGYGQQVKMRHGGDDSAPPIRSEHQVFTIEIDRRSLDDDAVDNGEAFIDTDE